MWVWRGGWGGGGGGGEGGGGGGGMYLDDTRYGQGNGLKSRES